MLACDETTFIVVPLEAPRSLNWKRTKGEAPSHQSARRAGSSCGGVIRHIEARAGTPAAPTHDRNWSRVNGRCPTLDRARTRGEISRGKYCLDAHLRVARRCPIDALCAPNTRKGWERRSYEFHALRNAVHHESVGDTFPRACITSANKITSHRCLARSTLCSGALSCACGHRRGCTYLGSHLDARSPNTWSPLFLLVSIRRSLITFDPPLRFSRHRQPWRAESILFRVRALISNGD